jgi:hypothetical protein
VERDCRVCSIAETIRGQTDSLTRDFGTLHRLLACRWTTVGSQARMIPKWRKDPQASDPNSELDLPGRGKSVLSSVYISRIFPLGPDEAVEAVEAWYRQLASAPGGRRLVAGNRLRVRPSFQRTDFDPLLLRRLRATLWVGWWWPVRVELELVRYSRFASEIALRPSSLRWPVAIERYGKDAARAIEEIVAAITTRVNTVANRPPERVPNTTRFTGSVLKPNPAVSLCTVHIVERDRKGAR